MRSKSHALLVAVAAGAALACGNAITSADVIQNGSFEANAPATAFYNEFFTVGNPTNWTYVDGSQSLNDAGYEQGNNADGGLGYTPNTIDGSAHWVTFRDNEGIYQDLGTTVSNNVTGNFTFSQGSQYNSLPAGVTISLWAGVPGTGVELSSETFAPVSVTPPAVAAITDTGSLTTGTGNAGAELYLELQQDDVPDHESNVLLDDVTLTLTSVPEPASLGIVAMGGAMLLRRRRRVH